MLDPIWPRSVTLPLAYSSQMEIFDKLFGDVPTCDRSANPCKQTSLGKKTWLSRRAKIHLCEYAMQSVFRNLVKITEISRSCEKTSLNRLGGNLFLTYYTRTVNDHLTNSKYSYEFYQFVNSYYIYIFRVDLSYLF